MLSFIIASYEWKGILDYLRPQIFNFVLYKARNKQWSDSHVH